MNTDGKLTLRQYLLIRTLEDIEENTGKVGLAGFNMATEAVSSTALAHPDWDLDARQEWDGWEAWVKDH